MPVGFGWQTFASVSTRGLLVIEGGNLCAVRFGHGCVRLCVCSACAADGITESSAESGQSLLSASRGAAGGHVTLGRNAHISGIENASVIMYFHGILVCGARGNFIPLVRDRQKPYPKRGAPTSTTTTMSDS